LAGGTCGASSAVKTVFGTVIALGKTYTVILTWRTLTA